MTSLERNCDETARERSIPVLETERLILRAPRRGDVKAIASLLDDRRIAANTARIPHPYSASDAEQFIASANRQDGEATFMIFSGDKLIGGCGIDPREDAPEIGYWLGVAYWVTATPPRPCARLSIMRSASFVTRRWPPAPALPIRLRAGCWRNARFSGPAFG
jgi:hypothetical protein